MAKGERFDFKNESCFFDVFVSTKMAEGERFELSLQIAPD